MRFSTKGSALLGRNFLAVFFINFCLMVAYYLLFIISAPYATEYFKASASVAGLVAGAMVLGCLAGRFITGRVIELFGFKRVLFVGIVKYTVAVTLYLATDSLPALLAMRFLSGVGVGIIGTVTGAVVAYVIPAHQHGMGISYFSLSTILAMAIGPFLGMYLMQVTSYSVIFILCAVLGVVAGGIALTLSVNLTPAKEEKQGTTQGFRLEDYIDYAVVPIATVMLVVSLGYSSVQAFISSYAKETELVRAAGMFFLVYAGVVFFTRPFTGKLLDTKGANVIAYPALVLFAAGLLLLGQTRSGWMMLLAGGLIGVGFGNFQSMAQAVTVKAVPRHRLGQATSTFFIFFDFGLGLGPYALGLLVPAFGYRGLYMAMAALTLVAVPLFHALYGREKGGPPTA